MSAGRPGAVPTAERTLVMGVLNVTADSFSDGGRYLDLDDAIAHGLALRDEGADIIDVGGESTRPGSERVAADTESARVVPVIAALAAEGIVTSVDTTRAAVARAAVDAGCAIINDVSGGLADPQMNPTAAELEVPYVLMHWRAHAKTMQSFAHYENVVDDVLTELGRRVDEAVAAGVRPERLIIDPGLGFAKTAEHNWALLQATERFVRTGLPVLIAASRKTFLGRLLADGDVPRPPNGREDATTAISALAAAAGAWAVRAHAVRPSLDAVRVAAAWQAGHA
ncbi:dihydropteroate synthase [Cumulibacter manganitolerans]|uniref:dihydropteroate synthase n=1 Tax=Cumulibacter manganitolerans TaxID=1884992 RepID=UPI0012977416|nr:dihydropteroate synthase [Cumulibacter manganitolerans]